MLIDLRSVENLLCELQKHLIFATARNGVLGYAHLSSDTFRALDIFDLNDCARRACFRAEGRFGHVNNAQVDLEHRAFRPIAERRSRTHMFAPRNEDSVTELISY